MLYFDTMADKAVPTGPSGAMIADTGGSCVKRRIK